MIFRRPSERRAVTSQPTESRGADFAWKAHSAITDWTAKVDTKAAIVLSLGGVVLGFFVTLSTPGRALAGLVGWRLIVGRSGMAVVALSVLLAALVVMPRLNKKRAQQTSTENFVYFGHLRYWKPETLQKTLQRLEEATELRVLSNQLVAASKIAWRKHRLLQGSMVSLMTGVLVVLVAAAWP